jgi:hypothetical protein
MLTRVECDAFANSRFWASSAKTEEVHLQDTLHRHLLRRSRRIISKAWRMPSCVPAGLSDRRSMRFERSIGSCPGPRVRFLITFNSEGFDAVAVLAPPIRALGVDC